MSFLRKVVFIFHIKFNDWISKKPAILQPRGIPRDRDA